MDLTTNPAPRSEDTAEERKETPGKTVKPSKFFVEYYGSVILLLIAILVGAGFLVIKPKLDGWKGMRTQTQTMRDQAENDRRYYEGLSRSVSASEGIDAETLAKLDKALPRTPLISDMIVEMGQLADGTGVKVNSISFEAGKTVSTSGLQTLNFNMALEAIDYRSMKNFFAALEKNLRLTEIQTLSFSSTDKGATTFTVSAKVFYYPTDQKAATAPPAANGTSGVAQ